MCFLWGCQVDEAEIDSRALAKLSDFETEQALEVLDQFCKCDLSKVRKKSAYLIGVMQRIKKTFSRANQMLQRAQERQKLQADRKRRQQVFYVGQQVLLSTKHL